jgi:hypothetical protein
MCADPKEYNPVWASGLGVSSAVTTCPPHKMVYSAGYATSGSATPYVYAVVPSEDGLTVTVRGGGGITKLSAIAVCGDPISHGQTKATVPLNPVFPTVGTAPALYPTSWVFGAGVESRRTGLFVDALGPYFLDDGSGMGAKARMAYLPAPPRILKSAGDAGDEHMIVYGESIGSWYY